MAIYKAMQMTIQMQLSNVIVEWVSQIMIQGIMAKLKHQVRSPSDNKYYNSY